MSDTSQDWCEDRDRPCTTCGHLAQDHDPDGVCWGPPIPAPGRCHVRCQAFVRPVDWDEEPGEDLHGYVGAYGDDCEICGHGESTHER